MTLFLMTLKYSEILASWPKSEKTAGLPWEFCWEYHYIYESVNITFIIILAFGKSWILAGNLRIS